MKKTDEYFMLIKKHEKQDYFNKEIIQNFVLITNNDKILAAYERMNNKRNTDCFFNENNYINSHI